MVADGVENVDLGVVERNHNILLREVQTCNNALIGRYLPRIADAAISPGCLDHVALFEMRPICDCLWSPLRRFPLRFAIEALCS